MPKRIRRNYSIYIAPQIRGFYDDHGIAKAIDEKNAIELNPNDTDDKIYIYERQVKEWFLNRATKLVSGKNNGFLVLMLCLSYLEGVEQYIKGEESNGNGNSQSKVFFRNSMHRIYPNKFNNNELNCLYKEARCGLFHNGMVSGKILINLNYEDSVNIPDEDTIQINPLKFLIDIKQDFNRYLAKLKDNRNVLERRNFNYMFSNI